MKVIESQWEKEIRIELEYLEMVLSKMTIWRLMRIPTIAKIAKDEYDRGWEHWEDEGYYAWINEDR